MINNFTKLQANVLALVAWADGSFCDEEKNRYIDFLDCSPSSDTLKSDLAGYIHEPPLKKYVYDEFSKCPKEVVSAVLKNAYLMAMANGRYDNEEKNTIYDLAIAAGVNPSNINKLDEMFKHYLKAHKIECQIFEMED
jgi:tellurite resistance protein